MMILMIYEAVANGRAVGALHTWVAVPCLSGLARHGARQDLW
jgi:hypothetical protein